ncbi:MAG: heavy metal translocating P-type ATPase [Halioglobus sp.]
MTLSSSPACVESPDSENYCFHCGEVIPEGSSFTIKLLGVNQAMCCPGCLAVAQLIQNSGSERFYQQRTALNQRPDSIENPADTDSLYDIYNDLEVNSEFSRVEESGTTHSRLLIGGITCAACTWLIEKTLQEFDGIDGAIVNLSQSRLDVSFDAKRMPLSRIFEHLEKLGYTPRPFKTSAQATMMSAEYRQRLRELAVAGLGMMQVGMFAIALHGGEIQGIENEYRNLLRWVSFLVATFVVFYSARSFFSSAWRHLLSGALVMDLPVSLAISLAWAASVWATVSGGGQVYFDSVVMFTFFLLLGRFLELRVRRKDQLEWVDAESSLPDSVRVLRRQTWRTEARKAIKPGDIVLIAQGETVCSDGEIVSGVSSIDESTLNGEHIPRAVADGDILYAGTINLENPVELKVLNEYSNTRLAALARSLDYAQEAKPALVQLADRIASRFVAFVLLASCATAIAWYFKSPSDALWVALSVLVISCPCAMALATPAALTSAANGLRRAGVIVRGENAIEALASTTHLIFDKTGTLTSGNLSLDKTERLSTIPLREAWRIATSLQVYSNHPTASAFNAIPADLIFERGKYHVGQGVEATLEKQRYRIGSREFCSELSPNFPPPPDSEHYWVGLCSEHSQLAWFGLKDASRDESKIVIEEAKKAGLQVELLTGDNSPQAAAIASELSIPDVFTGAKPEDKMHHVESLQAHNGIVTMVGDGLNDAPVLSIANASFAVAGATDLTRSQADFILIKNDLRQVTRSLKLAKKCRSVIRQNLSWAFCYNLFGIPLAAMGYVQPWLAAIGMSVSSLFVVVNSLRLRKNIAEK